LEKKIFKTYWHFLIKQLSLLAISFSLAFEQAYLRPNSLIYEVPRKQNITGAKDPVLKMFTLARAFSESAQVMAPPKNNVTVEFKSTNLLLPDTL
jgi:hypothetical protein